MWKVIQGHQQPVRFYLRMLPSFHDQSFLFKRYTVSVLDAITPCVIILSSAKHGGRFANCLMPICE